jgi:hypothetical protein
MSLVERDRLDGIDLEARRLFAVIHCTPAVTPVVA